MKTSSFAHSHILKKLDTINDELEKNNFSSWYFGKDDIENTFFLSIFDEHNPQEELVFSVSIDTFEIFSGYRYKKVKRSVIREEHIKYQQALEVLAFIKKYLEETSNK